MLASVVKYRPAIRSASNFPEAIIRLKAGPVIEPSGKANRAAVSRRSGVSGFTVSGVVGRFCTVDHSAPGMHGRRLLGRRDLSAALPVSLATCKKNLAMPGICRGYHR
jgi:hypothetical protein